ncbi:ParA family protein [Rugamonas rubra]|uniref:CobQ/CobB/MinD/ParA nucleotide binding domain-containing protein n=1 Tax=Rugamonas rubra TaxID=758825 RepID=A0A1I4TCC0_9BURK|nr:ParA family protein [Rugamonas rubra]SFM74326.1 CobQ/CobB/MinD/ParA nucleotide binding domain-containing protein [Rugamonas rubra]
MAKRLVVFNHKGGVSKTTTVFNLGWMLSKGHKVLLVDADSQCNLSSLVLGDDFEKYYLDDGTRLQNIKDGVAPAFQGKPVPISAVNCFSPQRAPSMYLLAGHANLSEYDAALTFAQTSNNAISTLQNLPGAFSELLRLTEEKYSIDYTIIDLNPSLSSVNQNLFLSAHAFLVPTNPDPFSIMALNTLQVALPRWVDWKKNAVSLFADSAYPLLEGVPKFCGSIIQRFNIRNGKAARPYRDNIVEIKEKLSGDFFSAMAKSGMVYTAEQYRPDFIAAQYCLAEVPDFQGLLPKSQQAGVPVFELTDREIGETGPVLADMQEKRRLFAEQFLGMAEKITSLMENA